MASMIKLSSKLDKHTYKYADINFYKVILQPIILVMINYLTEFLA